MLNLVYSRIGRVNLQYLGTLLNASLYFATRMQKMKIINFPFVGIEPRTVAFTIRCCNTMVNVD